jgi:hypothetical protein
MPEQTIIAWDLETVPDLSAAARMLDLGGATEAEARQALGEGFPKHPLHQIVCIGALVASRQPEGWRVDALGAPHTGERPEADLIDADDRNCGRRPIQVEDSFIGDGNDQIWIAAHDVTSQVRIMRGTSFAGISLKQEAVSLVTTPVG